MHRPGGITLLLKECGVTGSHRSGIAPRLVDFVERHLHRLAAVAQQVDDEGIAPSCRLAAIEQQQHLVDLANGAPGALHQPLTQQVVGLVDPRCIQQHQLSPIGCDDAAQPIPGGLGQGGGDRHLLAHQLVEQGGFADVRASDQGDKPRAEVVRQLRSQGPGGRLGTGRKLHSLNTASNRSTVREPTTTPSQNRFLESMQLSAGWLSSWEAGELSDEVLADRVADLVSDRDGARGFFVVAMTSEIPLLDRQPEALLAALRQAGGVVVDLTVRNLVMSSAMAVHHARQQDPSQLEGSQRVRQRATELLRQLAPDPVLRRLEPMLSASRLREEDISADAASSLPDAVRDDLAMLRRWSYDRVQREAIATTLEQLANPS